MVAAEIFVAHSIAPGNAGGGDQSCGKGLVCVRQQERAASAVEFPAVAGLMGIRVQRFTSARPRIDTLLPVVREGGGQRLIKGSVGGVLAVSKRDGDGELVAGGKIDFSHDSDIAVFSAIELPVHFEIVVQVLPSVAG